MNNVYILFDSFFPEHPIMGAFSTLEKAESAKEGYSRALSEDYTKEYVHIEEHQLDYWPE